MNKHSISGQRSINGSCTKSDRAEKVLAELKSYKENYTKNQLSIARLLIEVKSEKYWQKDYESLKEYISHELGWSMRMAQELMRVVTQCVKAGVSDETIAETGWSKVAQVAKYLTDKNASELINQAQTKSFEGLRELAKTLSGKEKKSTQKSSDKRVLISAEIAEALEIAHDFTGKGDIQSALEFVAAQFILLFPASKFLNPCTN